MIIHIRHGAILLLIAAAMARATLAQATEPSAADRETARELLFDGRAKLAAGDAAHALKAFRAAHAIMGVPTTGLDVAKAELALGLWVEARGTALDVARIPEGVREPEAFADARLNAVKLADGLVVRIPSLIIHIYGPVGSAVSVRVDGVEIPGASLTLPRSANPGEHHVEATASGYSTERRTVVLLEGQSLPVDLILLPLTSSIPSPRESQSSMPRTLGTPAPAEPIIKNHVPAWTWGVSTVGLATLGVGIGFAIDYAHVRSTVATDCPNHVCNAAQYDSAGVEALRSRWNRDLGFAVGLGAIGMIGVGTGIYGFIMSATTPSAKRAPPRTKSVATWWLSVGATGTELRGLF